MSLISCDVCGGPAKWTIIAGLPHYWCALCSQQLEFFDVGLEPKEYKEWNFPHGGKYVERERDRGGPTGGEDLPF